MTFEPTFAPAAPPPGTQPPATPPPGSPPPGTPADRRAAWHPLARALRELADPRYRWFHQLALAGSLLLFLITVSRTSGVDWGDRLTQFGYQIFVVAWFMIASYRLRTVGFREVVRFWLMGFFTVIFLTYLTTKPMRSLLGPGNLQSGVWVPIAEEVIKVLPLIAWTTFMRPKFRHGTLSDFWLLGLAIGGAFSFHEDLLYDRLMSSGFSGGLRELLFPTIYSSSIQYVVVHSGWTSLAGVGVGLVALYRHRWWSWVCGAALLAGPILDHGANNWRGSDLFSTITGSGQIAGWLLVLSVPLVLCHDVAVLRWATRRDHSFAPALIADDLAALRTPGIDRKVTALLWNQRYRRLRAAVFTDLYRTRVRGGSIGDRREVVRQLAVTALHAGKKVDRRLATDRGR